MTRSADSLDQAVPVQHRVDRALGRDAHVLVQTAHQQLANLARAPMRLLALTADNQALHLRRQLIGIAYRSPTAVAQRFETTLLVPIEDLVAGLAGDPELPAKAAQCLAIEQLGDKPQALVHHRTLLPRHRHLPLEGGKCYPCVRYVLLSTSRAAHRRCAATDAAARAVCRGGAKLPSECGQFATPAPTRCVLRAPQNNRVC